MNRPRRVRAAHVSGAGDELPARRDQQYDLLTAAVLGAAVGAGVTLLLRRGPRGRRPLTTVLDATGRGARVAGALGVAGARRGARMAARGAERAWAHVPSEEVAERVHDYVERARDTIDQAVESELKQLRKAIRKQRKHLGL